MVLLKGRATVVADPDGSVLVSTTGDERLATAGTGDVLAGVIGGLLAAGLPPLHAAAAGAFLHGRAGALGWRRGLVAGDLPDALPAAIADLAALRPDPRLTTRRTDAAARHARAGPDGHRGPHLHGRRRRPGRHACPRDSDIDAAPVVDAEGYVIGSLSTGDLIVEEANISLPAVITLLGGVMELPNRGRSTNRTSGRPWGSTVGEVMQDGVVAILGPDDTLEAAATVMHDEDLDRVPVCDDDGHLIGIIARGDILRAIVADLDSPAETEAGGQPGRRAGLIRAGRPGRRRPRGRRPQRRCAAPGRGPRAVVRGRQGRRLRPRRHAVSEAAVAAGADWLGVALVEEGAVLRKAGIQAPILLLSQPRLTDLAAVVRWTCASPPLGRRRRACSRRPPDQGKVAGCT